MMSSSRVGDGGFAEPELVDALVDTVSFAWATARSRKSRLRVRYGS